MVDGIWTMDWLKGCVTRRTMGWCGRRLGRLGGADVWGVGSGIKLTLRIHGPEEQGVRFGIETGLWPGRRLGWLSDHADEFVTLQQFEWQITGSPGRSHRTQTTEVRASELERPAELELRCLESWQWVHRGLAAGELTGGEQDVSRETRPRWFRAVETSTAIS